LTANRSTAFSPLSLPAPRSGGGATRTEGLVLPKADAGSGTVDLVAGVGYLPALQVGGDGRLC
jgi:hypothetical protein